MSGRGNRSTGRKPAPVPLCPLHIPQDLTRARTRAPTVGCRRMTASGTARAKLCLRSERTYISVGLPPAIQRCRAALQPQDTGRRSWDTPCCLLCDGQSGSRCLLRDQLSVCSGGVIGADDRRGVQRSSVGTAREAERKQAASGGVRTGEASKGGTSTCPYKGHPLLFVICIAQFGSSPEAQYLAREKRLRRGWGEICKI
jgi:hypothetical protein